MRPLVICLLAVLTASGSAAQTTAFPPDLTDVPAVHKRRLAVQPFDVSALKTSTPGADGILPILAARLQPSETVALAAKPELTLAGDVVIFGRDPAAGRVGTKAAKDDKAVVGIDLRLADAETGEVLATATVRGESSDASAQAAMSAATSKAVAGVVEFLESHVPAIPVKPRQVEGRVAEVTVGGAVLALGADDGVLRGDRFEIFRITGEIKDPVTRKVLDLDTVKVGEFVADNVRDRIAYGRYGGELMWSAYATAGRGYIARLLRK